MATLRALSYFDVVLGGRQISGGSRSKYKEFTVNVPFFDQTKSVGTSTTWDAWGFLGSEESVSDFDFLFIVSDLAGVLVELTCDANNGVGREEFTLGLITDFPLVLGSKVSMANYSADFASGAAGVIDRIRIHNPSLTTAANVRVALFT